MKGDTYKNWRKNIWEYITSDWFDASKSFITLPCFWAAIISVTSISLFVYLKIYLNNDLALCWEGDCVNYWASKFKVPIGIMALLIPILGLLNANHKSEQTRRQIELSSSQNNFINYYKHIDEYEKYVERVLKAKEVPTHFDLKVHSRHLYPILFPRSREGDYSVDEGITKKFLSSFNEINDAIEEIVRFPDKVREQLIRIYEIKTDIFKILGDSVFIGANGPAKQTVVADNKMITFDAEMVYVSLNQIRLMFEIYHLFMRFDVRLDVEEFQKILKLHYEVSGTRSDIPPILNSRLKDHFKLNK